MRRKYKQKSLALFFIAAMAEIGGGYLLTRQSVFQLFNNQPWITKFDKTTAQER